MVISGLLFYLVCIVCLLAFVLLGARLASFSRGFTAIIMLLNGALILYLTGLFFQTLQDSFAYRWYHFAGLFLLVGAMNNANLRGDATKEAQFASTFLFGGFVLMMILMF